LVNHDEDPAHETFTFKEDYLVSAAHFRSHGSVASHPGVKTKMKATVAAEEISEARCV